ncbi:MAG: Rnase Y domain-containing protein [bacterium]
MTFIYILLIVVAAGAAAYFAYQNQQLKQNSTNNSATPTDKKYSQKELEKQLEDKISDLEKEHQDKISVIKNQSSSQNAEQNDLILSKLKLELKEKLQEEEREMRKRILELQENVDKKEGILNTKLEKIEEEKDRIEKLKDELRNIKQDLLQKRDEVEKREQEVEQTVNTKLEEVGKLTLKEARTTVVDKAKEEMGQELISWQHKIVENAESDANTKARQIVALAVQRCSSEVANEFTITTIKLKGEEEKGKLIGKQGRNIQWIEKTLGVELIIDDTPEVVTISGFSSIRRNIAKRTIEKLLADGRIHPSSIEEMYEKSKAEIAEEIAEAGEWAVNDLGIYDFPAKLTRILGRLKFRTSYGQNMLKHSVEMAKLAGLLCDEMNAQFPNRANPIDKMICIKGALLHDVGKAVDEEMTPKGNHVDLGEKICDMFGLDWRIKKCISSHHNEEYDDKEHGFCVEAVLVDACDNISGGRPGARKETAEAYYQRMESLERIAESTPGVQKSWIMRGSKELWVFFDPGKITPAKMNTVTRKIAEDIASSVKSPVKIKIVGFYEDRVVEYAG